MIWLFWNAFRAIRLLYSVMVDRRPQVTGSTISTTSISFSHGPRRCVSRSIGSSPKRVVTVVCLSLVALMVSRDLSTLLSSGASHCGTKVRMSMLLQSSYVVDFYLSKANGGYLDTMAVIKHLSLTFASIDDRVEDLQGIKHHHLRSCGSVKWLRGSHVDKISCQSRLRGTRAG